jgi:acetyl-CoA carboxylase biotin carboxyl carrier protein
MPPMPDVRAHIAGTVFSIDCSVGDRVREGDVLLVLESMKMEMPLEAEEPGTVAAIPCAVGDAIDEGQVLVVLEG